MTADYNGCAEGRKAGFGLAVERARSLSVSLVVRHVSDASQDQTHATAVAHYKQDNGIHRPSGRALPFTKNVKHVVRYNLCAMRIGAFRRT
jgi:hypothetical protein